MCGCFRKKQGLTSLALRLPSSPSCSESLLDSLPPLCEDRVATCPLGRTQISTRAPSSRLPRPRTAGPLEPPSCSCTLRRSSCSAWNNTVSYHRGAGAISGLGEKISKRKNIGKSLYVIYFWKKQTKTKTSSIQQFNHSLSRTEEKE